MSRPVRHLGSIRSLAASIVVVHLLAPAAAAYWYIQEVDAPHTFTRSALRLDAGGNPAIAYGADNLYFAEWTGSNWDIEIVDEADCVGDFASLALDSAGRPVIAYLDYAGPSLKLARFDGNTWKLETVVALRRPAMGNVNISLALDATDRPYIAYPHSEEGRDKMMLALWDGASWEVRLVDDGGYHNSLAIDRLGNPVIAHSHASSLRVAQWDDGTWVYEDVPDSCEEPERVIGISMVLDSSDQPAVGYQCHLVDGLRYARRDSLGTWSVEVVDPDVPALIGYTALRHDAQDRPAISYYDEDKHQVRLGRWDGASWNLDVIDTVPWTSMGDSTALALDGTDNPIVTYQSDGLTLARWDGAAWSYETVDSIGRVSWGATSLALDGAGNPMVSYGMGLSASARSLRFARWDGSSWSIATLDDGVGLHSSLATDPLGHPTIAYYDDIDKDLELTRWNGASWDFETVDSAGLAGYYPSLAFDSTGAPGIAYCSNALDDIRYARWNGSSWDIDTDVSAGFAGPPSLAYDAAGNPAIAMSAPFGIPLPHLRQKVAVARWSGTAWIEDSLALGHDPFDLFPSLRRDPMGDLALAYVFWERITPDYLRMARRSGWTWRQERLLEDDGGLYRPSLAFAASGFPAISFGRVTLWDFPLLFLGFEGTGWVKETIDWQGGSTSSLAIDSEGRPWVSYGHDCMGNLRVASPFGPATLHRGEVISLTPGWRSPALPLTSANDDETPPFPLSMNAPGASTDDAPPDAPLTLYRYLWSGDRPARNTLRLVKSGSSLEASL